MYESLCQQGGYSGGISQDHQGRSTSDATKGNIESIPEAFRMLKQMRAQGVEWGEDYWEAGALALKTVLEQGMAARIDRHLEGMAERGEADRRNGSYGRWLMTELVGRQPAFLRALCHRRLHTGVLGRCGGQLPHRRARCQGTGRDRSGSGLPSPGGLGQRHRVHLECHASVVAGPRGRLALHRARQADAERVDRELHRASTK